MSEICLKLIPSSLFRCKNHLINSTCFALLYEINTCNTACLMLKLLWTQLSLQDYLMLFFPLFIWFFNLHCNKEDYSFNWAKPLSTLNCGWCSTSMYYLIIYYFLHHVYTVWQTQNTRFQRNYVWWQLTWMIGWDGQVKYRSQIS